MNVARLKELVSRVESSVEFDLGNVWRHYGEGLDGTRVLMVWWARGGRRLCVRLYPHRTTVEVSAYTCGSKGRVSSECHIGFGHDFLMVLRRGVDWLRSEAMPREFDPGREVTPIVPDYTEEP